MKNKSEIYKENNFNKILKELADQSPGALYQFHFYPEDETMFYSYVSEGIYDIFELYPEEIMEDISQIFARIYFDDLNYLMNSIRESAAKLELWEEKFRVILPQKGERWIQGNAKPQKNDNGSILWRGNLRDITAEKKKEQKLEFQLKFQKTLAAISGDLLNINNANIDRKINSSLKKIGQLFEIDRSYIFQFSNNCSLVSNTHEWCRRGIKSQIDELQSIAINIFPWAMKKLHNNQVININDVENMSSNKKTEQELLKELNLKSIVIMPMHIENELFGFFGFDFVRKKSNFSKDDVRLLRIFTDFITNVFSKHIDYQKIKKLTYYDSLTGIYNRRFFAEELKRLNTKRQLPISIIVADIDGLKVINDSFGHQKGDCLIKKSVELIKSGIREEDILARHGGDEFAILLPQTSKREAEAIISRIKNNTKDSDEYEFKISISFGIATKNRIEENIDEVFKLADDKMYQNKLSESKSIKNKIVQGLLSTLEVKSYETKEHTLRMTKLSSDFGKYLKLPNSEINRLSLLSTLHDIGKITVDDKILKKSKKLTAAEWEAMKNHSEAGYNIANSSEVFALVAEEIYSHHERWDGCGYPRGLKGREIPFLARIIFLIDTYDVITSGRPYRKALDKYEALKEIAICAGTQFDPSLAAEFIKFVVLGAGEC